MHCPSRRRRTRPRVRQEQKIRRNLSRARGAKKTAAHSAGAGPESIVGRRALAMKSLFFRSRKILIGVVHLQPLPGSPRWRGRLDEINQRAVADARAYERGGAHAVIIENFGDVPFTKTNVGPETIAAMTAAGCAVPDAVRLPIGFNVCRTDPRAALALCASCAGSFIRVNVHTGAMLTDQGLIEGDACHTVRYRDRISPGAQILADVHVKHAVPLGNG